MKDTIHIAIGTCELRFETFREKLINLVQHRVERLFFKRLRRRHSDFGDCGFMRNLMHCLVHRVDGLIKRIHEFLKIVGALARSGSDRY